MTVPAPVRALHQAAKNHAAAGDWAAASQAWGAAAARLTPELDPVARELAENMGVAELMRGRPSHAALCFLRALDGDLGSREQSLRLLTYTAVVLDQRDEAQRLRALYRATFQREPDLRPPKGLGSPDAPGAP